VPLLRVLRILVEKEKNLRTKRQRALRFTKKKTLITATKKRRNFEYEKYNILS
jgi:hypothetical protein